MVVRDAHWPLQQAQHFFSFFSLIFSLGDHPLGEKKSGTEKPDGKK